MKKVYKYDIPIQDRFSFKMPFGAEILHFGIQYNLLWIWVLVDTSKEMTERRFRLAGTGHDIIETGIKYIGTVKMKHDRLVYHLFEDKLFNDD